MKQSVNPYVTGAPPGERRCFFGRQDTLDWVAQELDNPATNTLVLLGQRAIGKTSLLLQLEHTLPTGAFLPVYFDLQGQAARPLGQVLAGLAGALAKRAGLQLPGSNLFDGQGHFFSRTFLPRFCAVALGENRRLVFLMDEFDALDETAKAELPEVAAVKALLPFLRSMRAGGSPPVFVFAAGRRAEDFEQDLAVAFDTPLVREVVGLDWTSAEELVRQAEANGTLQFSALAISHVLSFTSGHPYLTQLLCQRMWERAYAENPTEPPLIDTLAVEDAVPDVLEAGGRALAWLWDGLSLAERIYIAALAEIAEAGEAVSESSVVRAIADYAAWLCTPEVESASASLVTRWLLEKVGEQEHGFAVELFRLWVRQNKPLSVVENEVGWAAPLAEQAAQEWGIQPGQDIQVVAPTGQNAVSSDALPEEPRQDELAEAPVAARTVYFNVTQWIQQVRGAFDEARYVEVLRLALPVLLTPVLSALVFYSIGMSLVRGMSGLVWMPALFDASTFYRFALASAVLGVFPGIRFSYEFIKRSAFNLEMVYVSFYRFVFPFLAVISIYGALTLLAWVSRVSVSKDEWEGFRAAIGWLWRLWKR